MNQISLSSEKASALVKLLEELSPTSKQQAKLIDQLRDDIATQLNPPRPRPKSTVSVDKFILCIRDEVLSRLPLIEKAGLTKESVAYIKAVGKTLHTAASGLDDLIRPEGSPPPPVPSEADQVKYLTPFFNKLVRAGKKFEATPGVPLQVSENYPLLAGRQKHAHTCLMTGLDQARGAAKWEELDMIDMAFGDMESHVDLGVALLDGSPAKISSASDMDTACRDGLDSEVWDVVMKIANTYIRSRLRR